MNVRIEQLIKKHNGIWNPETMSWDFPGGGIKIPKFLTEKGRFLIKFGLVRDDFNCRNLQLVSLIGCPVKVGGNFDCSGNWLTSLEGIPSEIGRNINLSVNWLVSLEFCPKKINGNFNCEYNRLKSLEHAPKEVSGRFSCSCNQLPSFECPSTINAKGGFSCIRNLIL